MKKMCEYNQGSIATIIDKWSKIGFIAYDISQDAREELEEGNEEAYRDLISLSDQMKSLEKTLKTLSKKYLDS